ncbi:MAG: hypothetical protein SVS85_01250 [Candidatus Nanohaloarchaea archaeon]|nr:hypothetical protein [Candidatus Nanohaloarchaea archaeon]
MALQLMRGGAWGYSTIQAFAAAVLCVSVLYARATSVRKYVGALLVFQLIIFFQAPFVNGTLFDVSSMDERNVEADAKLESYVGNTPGNVYVEHAGYAIKTGKNLPPEIWGVYEQYAANKVSAKELRGFFRDRNYTRIIAYKRLYRLPLEDYLEENYNVTAEIHRDDMLLNQENWRVHTWTG